MLIPPEMADELPYHLKQMRRGKQIVAFETVRIRKDGQRRNVSITISPVRSADGAIVGSSGVFRDITVRKRAEETLRESEERYRHVFENAQVGIYRTTPDGRILFGNPALVKILGFHSAEEMMARNLEAEGFGPEYQRAEFQRLAERPDGVRGLEAAWTRQDGSIVYVRENAITVRDAKGRVLYYDGTVEDITDLKRADIALRESEERFRVLFDQANDGKLLADDSTKRFLLANCQIQKWLGYSAAELLQLAVPDIHRPDDLPRVLDEFDKMSRGETTTANDLPVLRKDGTVFFADVTAARFVLQGRRCLLGVFRDITERKRLEAEVLGAIEVERQHLGRDLHDGLGQHLASMSLQGDALQTALKAKGLPEATDAGKLAARARDAVKVTHDLARALYPASLQLSGLSMALKELAGMVREMFSIQCRFRGGKGIRLAEPNLERQLYRIAQEAAYNAAKHSKGRHIWIALRQSKHWLTLTIKDDGIGVPASRLAAHGLGINTMKYRANLIGAMLHIDSKHRHGTTVTCQLRRSVA